jgi:hypothetical protein
MANYFPLPLDTNQKINPIIPTTTNTPTQTPALNMPPITSQLLSSVIIIMNNAINGIFFILLFFERKQE